MLIHRRVLLTGPLVAVGLRSRGTQAAVESGFAELVDIRLAYLRTGHGPLMLFLHGTPDSGALYSAQLHEFGRDHLAVAPNLRGMPPSDVPAAVDAYAMPRLLDDIHGLLDHFGCEKAILVGNDWGGYFALVFTSAYPERVQRLIILNAVHPAIFLREVFTNPVQNRASQYERGHRSAPAPYPAWLNYYRADPIEVPDAADPSMVVDATRLTEPFFTGVRHPPSTTDLMVRRPTLVIWGMADDELRPGLLEGLAAYIADLTIVRLDDAGHYPMQSHAALVNRHIRDFLGR